MGEANIKSARGQYDEAVKMCEWIIRNGEFVILISSSFDIILGLG